MLPAAYQKWLDGLASGDPDSIASMPDPQQLIEQLSAENPKLSMLMRMMNLRRQAEAEQDMAQEDSRPAMDSGAQIIDSQDIEVERVLRRLYAEVDELRTRNDTLAAALGACYLCWGEDRDCPECHGRGGPGSTQPDRECFMAWVEPALRRLRPVASQARQPGERDNPNRVYQNTNGDQGSHNNFSKGDEK